MNLAVRSHELPPHRLTGVLEGVVHELGLLQALMLRMQDVCCTVGLAALDSGLVRELQGLDLMSQRLDTLSTVVGAVIEGVPSDPAVDLEDCFRALPLTDVADRLRAWSAGQVPSFDAADPGDLDLF